MECFMKFPNGKVWFVDQDGKVAGTVPCPLCFDQEQMMDAISEAVTGSIVGLTDFGYGIFGEYVKFAGNVRDFVKDPDNGCKKIPLGPVLWRLLKAQYGLSAVEIEGVKTFLVKGRSIEKEPETKLRMDVYRTLYLAKSGNYLRATVDWMVVGEWDLTDWSGPLKSELSDVIAKTLSQ